MSNTRSKRVAVLAVSAVTLAVHPITPPAHATGSLPDGFVCEQVVAGPFTGAPIGFAFLPDGRVLLIERESGGTIASVRLAAAGSSSSSVVHSLPDVDHAEFTHGLLGVAVDPRWPSPAYLYFYYTHTSGTGYVTRYLAQGEVNDPASTAITLAEPYHLLTDLVDDHDDHQGGTLRFGPDDMLYLSLGDDGFPNRCNAQDPTVLAGEILRLDVTGLPAGGGGPPAKLALTPSDNPFVLSADDNERLVFALGERNPFRFTIDPQTGDLLIGNVGQGTFEELNLASGTPPYQGENFGWPFKEGTVARSDTCGSGNQATDPIYAYPAADGGPQESVIAGPRYRVMGTSPPALPPSHDGSIFLLEFYDGWIRRLVEGESGWEIAPVEPGQPSSDNWGEGFQSMSDFQEGPDGALYLLRHFGAGTGLHRITHNPAVGTGAGQAPTPVVVAFPNPARAELWIRWQALDPGPFRIRIHTPSGRVVREFVTAAGAAGGVRWDGRDTGGRPVGSGVYFYRLVSAARVWSGRLTLVR